MSDWHDNSLNLTNALIGLTRPDETWKSPLAAFGYRVHWLERTLTSARGSCQPDIIMSSAAANHALVFEVKCGSLQVQQHTAYSALAATDLRDCGIPDTGDGEFTFDIAYATGSASSESLTRGLEDNGRFPLVVFTDEMVSREVRAFSDEDLETIFAGVIDIAGLTPPLGYVPFNDDSTDLEIMTVLVSAILASLRHGDAQLTTNDLLRSAVPFWASFAQAYQTALCRRVERLLNRHAACFSEFFEYVGSDVPHRLVMRADLSRLVGKEMYETLGRWDSACAECLRALGALEGQLPLFED